MKTNFNSEITIYDEKDNELPAIVSWEIEAEVDENGISGMQPKIFKILVNNVEWTGEKGWEFESVGQRGVSFRLAYGNIYNNILTLYFAY